MHRIQCAMTAVAVIGFASVAFAADMPVKAPPPAPVPVVTADWTGLYFDADIGWEQSRYNWSWPTASPLDATFGVAPFSMSQNGGVMGGHVGYQQQFGWLVVGGEFGASGLLNSRWATTATSAGACLSIPNFSCQALIGNVVTGGGRLGVDWGDWLVYGVGGGAWGSVGNQTVSTETGSFNPTNGPRYSGYYAGIGVDYMFAKTGPLDMIVGVEYEHVDLGSETQVSLFIPGSFNPAIGAKEDIVWGKLTVKFNPWR
jgi:outer membrane immunogenic protein